MKWTLAIILAFTGVQAQDDILDLLGEESSAPEVVQATSGISKHFYPVLGRPTAEQNIFFSFLDRSEYDKALYQWWPAFDKTRFAKSDNGVALYSFLLLQSGLPINATEALFHVKEPNSMVPALQDLWRKTLPPSHLVWDAANIQWNEKWSEFWGPAVEVVVSSRLRKDMSVDEIAQLLRRAPDKGDARARLLWRIALNLNEQGETAKAAKFLVHLMKLEQSTISPDLLNLTVARILYANGHLDPARKYYSKIDKQSEYWFVAQEELAWTFMRKGEPQNTLAVTKTLLIPEFQAYVGPEAVFLRSLSELKVCDYPRVGQSIEYFKWRYKHRAKSMQSIVDRNSDEVIERLFAKLAKGPVRLYQLGDDADRLPRYVARDQVLYNLVQTQKRLLGEAKVAADLYSRSLAGGSSQVGFQAWIEDIKTMAETRARAAVTASRNLLITRAQGELKEIENILQKMHIIEAEAIQQTSMAERVAKVKVRKEDLKMGSTGSDDEYALRFKYDGEKWFDEISNYKIDIKKACHAMRGDR